MSGIIYLTHFDGPQRDYVEATLQLGSDLYGCCGVLANAQSLVA
jgi:hypothetical protein